MSRVRRFDAGELEPPRRLPNGWLQVEGKIARVGTQVYENADGTTHIELRLPEEVFDPESLASFAMVPVTNTHPPVLLDAQNTGTYAKGSVGENIRRDGDWIVAPLMITDAQTITYAEAGRAQLSNGYTCELDATQDPALVEKWGKYDLIQRKIRGNHVALVDEARAGPEARIRLDAGDARAVVKAPATNSRQETAMAQLRFDGNVFDLTDANAPVIQQAVERMLATLRERSDAALSVEKGKTAEATKRADTVKANATRLVEKLSRIKAKWDAMKARMVQCDECGGEGKVQDAADPSKMVKCDLCDGEGQYRMHSPVAGKTDDPEDGDGDDDDLDDEFGDDDEEMDADELEVEQETEQEAGKAKKDARRRADARRKRADEAKEFAEKYAASMQRRVDRAVKARVALETEARRFVGSEPDLTKLDELGIRKAVIQKLSPGAKLDGKTPEQIRARYDAELERVGTAGVDAARLGTAMLRPHPARTDTSGLRGRELYQHRLMHPEKPNAGK